MHNYAYVIMIIHTINELWQCPDFGHLAQATIIPDLSLRAMKLGKGSGYARLDLKLYQFKTSSGNAEKFVVIILELHQMV